MKDQGLFEPAKAVAVRQLRIRVVLRNTPRPYSYRIVARAFLFSFIDVEL